MARKLRVEYEGAIHHVTCRLVGAWHLGDRELFVDDRDRWRFLDSLGERVELYGTVLHQYALMANHFHLVVETPRANCSAFMQSLLTSYTQYFNLRHDRHGHLFDGRFKAKLVEGDEYLLALSRYVHLNPVRVSGLEAQDERAKVLRSYYWSSYLQYIGRRKKLEFLTCEPTLALTNGGRRRASAYREYVERGLHGAESGLGESRSLSIGSSGFHEFVAAKYQEMVAKAARPEDVAFRKQGTQLSADEVVGLLAGILDCTPDAFVQRRHGDHLRPFAAYFLSRFAGLSRRACAEQLGVTSGPAVTLQIDRYRTFIAQDRVLRRLSQECEVQLSAVASVVSE